MSENGNYHNNSAFEMQRFTMSAAKPDVKLIDVNTIKKITNKKPAKKPLTE